MSRPAMLGLVSWMVMGCSAASQCVDAGADAGPDAGCFLGGGGGSGGSGGNIDPTQDATWNVLLDSFNSDVSITNLSYADQFCTISGGSASGTFTHAPGLVGTSIGTVDYAGTDNGGPSWTVRIYFDTSYTESLSARSGTATGIGAVSCDAETESGQSSYTMNGDLAASSGSITLDGIMPVAPLVGGNISCQPSGNSACDLKYFQPNDPAVLRTAPFDVKELVSGHTVTITFDHTATNVAEPGETRTGQYHWTGTLKAHSVRQP